MLGLAPWHGRILVLDRDDAGESTGHGSPLPMLVHGGPGRAGGGEELGGVRGVLHHMQRTAIQASPDMLTAITGRWTTGLARRDDRRRRTRSARAWPSCAIGDTIASAPRQVTLDDIDHFAEFTGDTFYAHTDPEAAAKNPLFGGIVAHGYLMVSLAAGLFVDPDPGPVLANFGVDNLRFLTPVKAGDSIAVTLTVKQITPRANADYGEVRWDAAGHQRRRRAGGDVRRADAGRQGVALDVVAPRAGESSSPGCGGLVVDLVGAVIEEVALLALALLVLAVAAGTAPGTGAACAGLALGTATARARRRRLPLPAAAVAAGNAAGTGGPRQPMGRQGLSAGGTRAATQDGTNTRAGGRRRCRARHWLRVRRGRHRRRPPASGR